MSWQEELEAAVSKETLLAARDRLVDGWAGIAAAGFARTFVERLEESGAIELKRENGQLAGEETGNVRQYFVRLTPLGEHLAADLRGDDA